MTGKKTHKALLKDFMSSVKDKVDAMRDGEISQDEFLHWMNGYASAALIMAENEEDDA